MSDAFVGLLLIIRKCMVHTAKKISLTVFMVYMLMAVTDLTYYMVIVLKEMTYVTCNVVTVLIAITDISVIITERRTKRTADK
jgi:lipid-A-disaccharide synthase-like uncharacterized protein